MGSRPGSLVLLSGGIDSCVVLHQRLTTGDRPRTLFVDYGQPASALELRAAQRIAEHFRAPLETANVRVGIELRPSEIIGRNALLVTLAALRQARTPTIILLGVHSGTPYFDCSGLFVQQMQSMLDGYSGGHLQLLAPLLDWVKADILAYAAQHNLPVSLTRSCEASSEKPCGNCLSCRDRKDIDV